jgi:hypothetical protein
MDNCNSFAIQFQASHKPMERKTNISFKQKRLRETLNEHPFDLILVHCSCFHQRAERNYLVSYRFPLINSKTWGATPNGQFSFQHMQMFLR